MEEAGVSSAKVFKRIEPAREQAPQIWEYAANLIENAIDKGMLKR